MIDLTCTNNGLSKPAEILNESDKYMKVVVEGTAMTIELYRNEPKGPYVGHKAGLEFKYQPE
ncbi:MAG: hypothetical protein CMM91_05840 [Rickettsiales bacterium]|jgi:hypothetical protein|nr:hypothetical protein [Rickettsiales bacterium]MAI84441.1 hypothetical protein [Rickettsiales bacterium]|tara:strand:+ start:11025 stop:11210 length:186 start_codon:yes stop_codon:yes gene_type:complete